MNPSTFVDQLTWELRLRGHAVYRPEVETFVANAWALIEEDPEDLTRWAAQGRTVLMCSEAVPWRCHRRLIADALIVRGWTVWDIIGPGKVDAHKLTEFARVRDGRIAYPAMALDFDDSAR